MFVKQLTVFLENRKGSLEEVTGALKNNNINILSISLADTTEYGLLRMIVSDADQGRDVLRKNGFSAMLTDVIGVEIRNEPGTLHDLLSVISKSGISVEYMYVLASTKIGAMIIKTSNGETATRALLEANMRVLDNDTVCESV